MGQVPYAKVYLSENQLDIVSGATWTLVNYDSELLDIGSNFNTTTHRFVVPVPGFYHVQFLGVWIDGTVVADKVWRTIIREGGDTYYNQSLVHSSSTGEVRNASSDVIKFAKDDYIEILVQHNAGVDTPDLRGSLIDYTNLLIYLVSKD